MRWIVFAALLAVSCASERALNVGDTARETERALSVGDTTWKEIRINGETISAQVIVTEIAEYDSSGDMTREVNGFWDRRYEYEYDANGRKIRSRNDNGTETRYEYDANGNMVHAAETDAYSPLAIGFEWWYKYDGNGKLSCEKSVDKRNSHEIRYQYDDKGNMIRKTFYGADRHLFCPEDYPPDNTFIIDTRFEYDEKGWLIHSKSSVGSGNTEEWFEYDDKGNLICRRWPSGTLFWTDYTFWQNGKVKTKIEYIYYPKD